MKTLIGAFALAIASPALAQPAQPAQGTASHAQPGQHGGMEHGQHGQHGQHGGMQHGSDGCCADRDDDGRPDCCREAASGEGHGCGGRDGAPTSSPQRGDR